MRFQPQHIPRIDFSGIGRGLKHGWVGSFPYVNAVTGNRATYVYSPLYRVGPEGVVVSTGQIDFENDVIPYSWNEITIATLFKPNHNEYIELGGVDRTIGSGLVLKLDYQYYGGGSSGFWQNWVHNGSTYSKWQTYADDTYDPVVGFAASVIWNVGSDTWARIFAPRFGVDYSADTTINASTLFDSGAGFGSLFFSPNFYTNTTPEAGIYYTLMWDRALSTEELRSLDADPWQVFLQPTRFYSFPDYGIRELIKPTAILAMSGLSGVVTDVRDSPQTPDDNWLVVP